MAIETSPRTMQVCIDEIKGACLQVAKLNLQLAEQREKLEKLDKEFKTYVDNIDQQIISGLYTNGE